VIARPWTLPAAAWLAGGEAAVLIAALALSGAPGAGLWIVFLAVKFPFCWLLVRLRPGAYLALMVWELAGAVAAIGARGEAMAWRLLEVGVATAVMALLIASTPLFPSVRLPESST
jgi:hypothetical protein